MIVLPDQQSIASCIEEALKAVENAHRKAPIDAPYWFQVTAGTLAAKLSGLVNGIECCAGRKLVPPPGCQEKEWVFDFCALAYDPSLEKDDPRRFPEQALAIGEVEWSSRTTDVDGDFQKLFIADALVLFFVTEAKRNDAGGLLERLKIAVEERFKVMRPRYRQMPTFVLACWITEDHHFGIRRVDAL